MCFSFKVGNTPHKAAMRSMELMIGEVKPKVEKAAVEPQAGAEATEELVSEQTPEPAPTEEAANEEPVTAPEP